MSQGDKKPTERAIGCNPTHHDGGGLSSREQGPQSQVIIVVPTYNEAENLPDLVGRVFALGLPNVKLLIVDDGSPDGTGEVAMELSKRYDGRVGLIRRDRKLGIGTAYVDGFARALTDGAEVVLQMDADLSHTPESIPGLLERLAKADVVVGSRYIKGGGVKDEWSLRRRFLSFLGNLGIRIVVGLSVKDATSGFKAFRGEALRSLDLARFRCKGFAFQSEMAGVCQRRGFRVVEHPIVFAERAKGSSKMSLAIILEALWCLLPSRWTRV